MDRVGAGDSFAAGVIMGHMEHMAISECLEFAVAASCLKHTIHNDFLILDREEATSLVNNYSGGRINR